MKLQLDASDGAAGDDDGSATQVVKELTKPGRSPSQRGFRRSKAAVDADVFAEKLQDQFEYEDQLSLIRFAWLMHRKTLVGVQRFENLLHHKFDELVDAGVLQARTSPPAKPRAR